MEKQDPIDDTEETQQKLVGYDPLGDPLAVAPLPDLNTNEVGFFAEIWQVLGRLFSNSGGGGGASKGGKSNVPTMEARPWNVYVKNMDKNTVRRMNPQFANMSDQELDMMATQMEMMVELCGNQPVCRVVRRAVNAP